MNAERTGWARELMGVKVETAAGSERAKLREQLDSQVEFKSTTFELGKSDVPGELNTEVNAANPEVLVASVDATRFAMKWHKSDWYKPFVKSAVKVAKLKDLFDGPTAKWCADLSPALEIFQKLSTYDDVKFKKNVKPEIWKLVKAGGEKMIYGKDGLFNFLLAFDRLQNFYSPLQLADREDFKLADLPAVKKIKLVRGNGVGRKGGKNDRFAYAAVRKGAKQAEPAKPKEVDPAKPLEKPKEVGVEFPAIGTPEFFVKYEIDKAQQPDFMAKIKLFNDFLANKDRGVAFLQRTDWLKKDKNETDGQYTVRMVKLFDDASGEIATLRTAFIDTADLNEKFYQNPDNPDAFKYVNLYTLATLRSIDFADKNLAEDGPGRVAKLKRYHNELVEALDPLKSGVNKKAVLPQLVISANYLYENTEDDEDMDGDKVFDKEKWKKSLEEYKK